MVIETTYAWMPHLKKKISEINNWLIVHIQMTNLRIKVKIDPWRYDQLLLISVVEKTYVYYKHLLRRWMLLTFDNIPTLIL